MAEGKGSLIMWLAATVGLAVVGAGVGGFLGITIVDKVKAFEKEQADRAPPPVATSTPRYGPNMALMDLPPIISNLADPPNAWVRLQAAIIYDAKAVPKPQMLAATVSSDVLAYLKTVTIAQTRNLILLSGFRPEEDIRIEFTGMRPGEKLYEELSTLLEDTVPSKHDKIRIFVGNGVPAADIDTWLASLHTICAARDAGRLVVALKELVPDYSPSVHLLKRITGQEQTTGAAVPLN